MWVKGLSWGGVLGTRYAHEGQNSVVWLRGVLAERGVVCVLGWGWCSQEDDHDRENQDHKGARTVRTALVSRLWAGETRAEARRQSSATGELAGP